MIKDIKVKLKNLYNDLDEIKSKDELLGILETILLKWFNEKEDISIYNFIVCYLNNMLSIEGLEFCIINSMKATIEIKEYLLNYFKQTKFKHIINRLKQNSQLIQNPLITIIITTYNRKIFLQKAIDSVIKQSYENKEIIIMDDFSRDGTDDIIKEKYDQINYIKYYKNEKNYGCGYTRLKAYNDYCKGKYVIFLDDDDFFIDFNYFKDAIILHEKYKNLAFVASNNLEYYEFNKKIRYKNIFSEEYIDSKKYFVNFNYKYKKPVASAAVFSKKALNDALSENVNVLNDTSIFLRSLLNGNAGFVNTISTVYRIHGSNITFKLEHQLVLNNLIEKLKISIQADLKFKLSIDEINEWVYKQLLITTFYYLKNTNVSILNFINLMKFFKKNTMYTYNKIKYKAIKLFIKNKIKIWIKNESKT